MKRFLLLLALGLITVNVTNGCKPAETTTTPTPTITATNATTNAVPPPAH
ncbi:MAG TPA: hypothetical protein VH595_21360 [Verrucomicrobiae bacterium]|jgi:hypothetical protein|nr:hypothetical protein [Verrucomicrobiae bacterium]